MNSVKTLKRSEFSQAYLRQHAALLKDAKDIHEKVYLCVVGINDFQAGSIAIKELINGSRSRSFRDFQVGDISFDPI